MDMADLDAPTSPLYAPPTVESPRRRSSLDADAAPATPAAGAARSGRAKTISNMEALIHLLKGNIGTGMFAVPEGFRNAGLVVGSIGIPIIAFIVVHCMHILVNCAAMMQERRDIQFLDYAEVTEVACATGSFKRLAKHAVRIKKILNIFLCLTQLGFCCVYVVFVANNLKEVVVYYAPSFQVDIRVYMAILTVPLIFLDWIRNLKYLTPVSLVANVLQTVCLVLVFYYMLQDLPAVDTRPAFASWSTLPLYFGTVVFAFLGISLILPLQNEMRSPRHFGGTFGVLNIGMAIVTCLQLLMGFFGYLKYGDAIQGSVTLNLPQDEIIAQLVKLMMVLAIFGSYTIQFYVPMKIMWPSLASRFSSRRYRLMGEYVFRTCLVLMTFVLAALIPQLDLFISLIGALCSSFLALIFPPMLELIIHGPEATRLMVVKDVLIISFGLIVFATGTYASVASLTSQFSQSA